VELYESWQMFQDPTLGQELLIYSFDGSPVAPLRPVANGPLMLPTQLLRNDSSQASATPGLTTQNALAMNNGRRRWSGSGTIGALTVVFGVGLGSLLL
jgi:Chaperone for protein-folding within the ER, fungal